MNHSKTIKLSVLVFITASLFSNNSFALSNESSVYIPEMKVETTQFVDTKTSETKTKFKIDGIEIQLTKEEKVKARNWNLTNEDWAKYKYIMKYMPRGLWTPDIDPPLALGNLEADPKEAARYARVFNAIQINRQQREAKFTTLGQSLLPINGVETTTNKGRITKYLPDKYNQLKTIFLDIKTCNADCRTFLTKTIASTGSSTKLDVVATGGTEKQLYKILSKAGFSEERCTQKNISIDAKMSNPKVLKHSEGKSIPYYVLQTDDGARTSHMR